MIHAVVMTFLALALNNAPNSIAVGSGKVKFPPRAEKPKPPPQDKPSQDRPDPDPPDEEEPRPRKPNHDKDSQGGFPPHQEAPYLAVIRRNMPQIESCYDRARTWSPALQGEVVVEWVISPDGDVEKAEITGNTTGHTELAGCILQAVKSWQFRDPNMSYPSHVRHPFRFQPS